jgi:hypothetical protein
MISPTEADLRKAEDVVAKSFLGNCGDYLDKFDGCLLAKMDFTLTTYDTKNLVVEVAYALAAARQEGRLEIWDATKKLN